MSGQLIGIHGEPRVSRIVVFTRSMATTAFCETLSIVGGYFGRSSSRTRRRTLPTASCTELFSIACPSITTPRLPSHANTYSTGKLSTCDEVFSRARVVIKQPKFTRVEEPTYAVSAFPSPLGRLKHVEWRREVCRWEKRKRRARIRSNCARVSPRSRMPVATQRRYAARRAESGFVMPTQRMTSSIHARCHLVMRAARPKNQANQNPPEPHRRICRYE
jgi:hypothetical protein